MFTPRHPADYAVEMKVPAHASFTVLRMPTAKEMQGHERASTSAVAARRLVETCAFLEPSGAVYDGLHIWHDGYAGPGCRLCHKSAAVSDPTRAVPFIS